MTQGWRGEFLAVLVQMLKGTFSCGHAFIPEGSGDRRAFSSLLDVPDNTQQVARGLVELVRAFAFLLFCEKMATPSAISLSA